jgi:LPXTG-site transpeptidase (sortase) family protein
MHPKGTIYHSDRAKKHGETHISLPFVNKIAHTFARGIGAGLIGYFVINTFFIFGPLIREEIDYRLEHKADSVSEVNNFVNAAKAETTIEIQKEADSWGVNSYFSVVIPKIDARSNVIPNVDIGNKAEYMEALSKGVAHAKGTYFPGQGKQILLFAHSTDSPANIARFNAVFFLLRKLEKGDRIIVYFADKKYVYEVSDKLIAESDDTSWLDEGEDEKLILLTCDPPGTTWRRLLIIAKPVSD